MRRVTLGSMSLTGLIADGVALPLLRRPPRWSGEYDLLVPVRSNETRLMSVD